MEVVAGIHEAASGNDGVDIHADEDQKDSKEGQREDPTSKMIWSPIKIAGHKRTLEERLGEEEEEESEEGEIVEEDEEGLEANI